MEELLKLLEEKIFQNDFCVDGYWEECLYCGSYSFWNETEHKEGCWVLKLRGAYKKVVEDPELDLGFEGTINFDG